MAEGEGMQIDQEKIKAYAANASRVGGAVAALFKHDGWQIFLAMFDRKKQEIQGKRMYKDLAEANADGLALDIVEGIIEELAGFMDEANDAQKALEGISPAPEKSRGIMLIEAMEDSNREST